MALKAACWCGLVFLLWTKAVHADYKFITGNSFVVQKRLVDDIKAGHFDATNAGPYAIESISKESVSSATPNKLNQLGPIDRICFLVGVGSPTSRSFNIRTIHQNGCGDWVITAEVPSERLTGIVLFPAQFLPGRTDECGPPRVISPPATGGSIFLFPADLRCRNIDALSPPQETEELKKACEIAPGMCNRAP